MVDNLVWEEKPAEFFFDPNQLNKEAAEKIQVWKRAVFSRLFV